jgi:hypothetical protein
LQPAFAILERVTDQALRNAALAAAAANPEILPLEFLLGDDTFMDRYK